MSPTPTLRLRHLFAKAFRSFVDEVSIDLPESGLHLILGKSGAGKTSFVEALAFNLDYSEFPATAHQTWPWLTDEKMETGLDFWAGGVEKGVRRGRKPTFSGGPLLPAKEGASVVNEEMRKALGIEPEMLKALTYRPQRQPGLFLAMKDAAKKTFLTSLLRLGPIEQEVEATTKGLTALEKAVADAKARYEQALGAVPAQPVRPEPPDLTPQRERVEAARRAVAEAEWKFDEARAQHDTLVNIQKVGLADIRQRYAERIIDARDVVETIRRRHQGGIVDATVKVVDAKKETFKLDPDAATKLEKLKARLKLIQDGIAKFQAEQRMVVTGLRAAVEGKKQHLWELQLTAGQKKKLEQEREKLLTEKKSLEEQVCPTCHQGWATEEAKHRLTYVVGDILDHDGDIRECDEAAAAAVETRKTIEAAQADLKTQETYDAVPQKFRDGEVEYTQAIADLAAEQKAAFGNFQTAKAARVATLEAEVRALQAVCNSETAGAEVAVKDLETRAAQESNVLGQPTPEILAARAEVAKWEKAIAERTSAEREAKNALEWSEERAGLAVQAYEREAATWKRLNDAAVTSQMWLEAQQAKVGVEEDFLALLKSFLSLVFDETLQGIAAKANDLLNGIPNVAGMTVAFTSEHETKTTGSVRQEIRVMVRKDGHEIPFRAGCSGGQQAAIELAVDLALAQVISERVGIYPGWLVLDEAFDGLDDESKSGCLDVLAKVAEDRAIFVIDHSAVVQERFDSIIRVEHEDGRSRIAVA